MMVFYNIGILLLEAFLKVVALWRPKERKMVEGRRGLAGKVRAAVKPSDRIFWLHAASVGEFEQGRPLIEEFRAQHPEYKILLTFFSSSGYELRKDYKGADYVFYLPFDRPRAVREFLDAAHPELVYIVKYEFWLNLLSELRRRGVRTYLLSAIFHPGSAFFKPWGGIWRKALGTFDKIFVQNRKSLELLEGIGVRDVLVTGDTRFDRVFQITQTPISLPLIESFCDGKRVFVAGSTWGPDEEILVRLINDNPSVKFIVAPHEMSESRICRLMSSVNEGACRYTRPETVSAEKQLLVVDTVGLLSHIYRYACWAYVGGGFGIGIHNTLEPAAYGLPIAFGPKYKKFDEAVAMTALGISRPVSSYEDLAAWFRHLLSDEPLRQKICAAARSYTTSQLGATNLALYASHSRSAKVVFDRAIEDYHKEDNVDAEFRQPFREGSLDAELYKKCWIDTVQWHLEDIIRDPEIDPAAALALKRRIDRSNQERTDLVERIDSWYLAKFQDVKARPEASVNTESPAWAIDRLSILELKIYHMRQQTERTDASEEHLQRCNAKLQVLLEQRSDLSASIDQLLSDYESGRKVMKVYRQMKMYNDAATNPVLYNKK